MRTVRLDQPVAPKLVALSIRNADIPYMLHNKLLDILKERHIRGVGLEDLYIWSCHVPAPGCKKELEGLVKTVTWDVAMDSDHDTETEERDSEDGYRPCLPEPLDL